MSGNMTAAERLLALLDHLGIGKAHVATQIPADIAGLSMQHAERLGGIVLCTPVRLDPAPFGALAERVRAHVEIRAAQHRPEECLRRAPAPPAALIHLKIRGAESVAAVEFGDLRYPALDGRVAPRVEDLPAHAPLLDAQFPARAVELVGRKLRRSLRRHELIRLEDVR